MFKQNEFNPIIIEKQLYKRRYLVKHSSVLQAERALTQSQLERQIRESKSILKRKLTHVTPKSTVPKNGNKDQGYVLKRR